MSSYIISIHSDWLHSQLCFARMSVLWCSGCYQLLQAYCFYTTPVAPYLNQSLQRTQFCCSNQDSPKRTLLHLRLYELWTPSGTNINLKVKKSNLPTMHFCGVLSEICPSTAVHRILRQSRGTVVD